MTVIWGSTMFVLPDGRRFHCLFYVEATHELFSHTPSLWTLLLAAASQLLIVIRWFGLFTSSKGLQKKNSRFWLEMWTSTASHLVFLQAVINVSVCPCCVSPPRQGETPPPKRHLYSQHTSSHLCGPSAERLITWCVCVSLQGAG